MVSLERFRWWHVPAALLLEEALFPDERWTARTFWSELGQVDTRSYVVALSGSSVVGYAGLCDYPDEAWVQTMAVARSHQRQGLGQRLLSALLEEADRRGQRVVSLEVAADNGAAQRLYARNGFTRIAVRRGYYQPSGTDAWVMTRRVSS